MAAEEQSKKHQEERDRQFLDALEGLEAQKEAQRHLQVQVDKPCASMFFTGNAFPEVGERSTLFFALAAELRRIGSTESKARDVLKLCYERLPTPIKEGMGSDRRPFSIKEVQAAAKSVYRNDKIKSYGCNSHIWDQVCIGADSCHFRKLISAGHKQSQSAQHYAFLTWLAAKTISGRPLLKGTAVKVYLGVQLVEKKRGYKAGSLLYVSWRELAELSGVAARHIGQALENLEGCGLIEYKKGLAFQRGAASEIQRVLPVPNYKGTV